MLLGPGLGTSGICIFILDTYFNKYRGLIKILEIMILNLKLCYIYFLHILRFSLIRAYFTHYLDV